MPASFSSGRANSDNVGRDLRFRNSILSLWGENDNAGRGGASTMSISSFGGRRYPTSDSVSSSFKVSAGGEEEEEETEPFEPVPVPAPSSAATALIGTRLWSLEVVMDLIDLRVVLECLGIDKDRWGFRERKEEEERGLGN
jgi:hypothetical protein